MRDPISEGAHVKKRRVLVVDDHPLMREALVQLINRQHDLVCCGQAYNSTTAQAAVLRQKPDLVLLDLRLGEEDGLEFIKSLKSHVADLRILVFSQSDEILYAERALRVGALGYVMKDEEIQELTNAVRAVLKGERYVSRKVALRVFEKSLELDVRRTGSGVEALTDRELQVFELLGAGFGTRAIGEKLKLSVKTIETYRENIKHKLGLRGGVELVQRAADWVQRLSPRAS